jgi:malyl-CoA/(S)-citramalyl-CoA lyase
MSFQMQPTPVARLNRCQLFGPGSRPEIFEKMALSAADVVNLDLEDSVAPGDKEKARSNVIEAINSIDWKNKTVSVRINSLDTPFWHRDIIDLLENCSERLDNLTIPKAGCAADIYAVDALVSSVEQASARSKKIGFDILIESAAGLTNVNQIATSSSRIESMAFGAADFAASMGMVTTGIGGTQDGYYMHHAGQKYWCNPWHWAQASLVAACRSSGILPVDGPYGDFNDHEGFIAEAKRASTLGMVGKWAIHPNQIAPANKIFTPSLDAIEEAKEIIKAMNRAKKNGEGAIVFKGRMVDIASIKQAEVLVKLANLIGSD